MARENITSALLSLKTWLLPIIVNQPVITERDDAKEKTCQHRDQNGWCNKSQRPCGAFKFLNIKH